MKCVKMIYTNTVIRVTDAEANKLVNATLAQYCPKWAWKAQRDVNAVKDAANV